MHDVRGNIDLYGWALQYVLEDQLADSYAYTCGLTLRGLPELVVVGLAPEQSWSVLNDVAAQMTAGRRLAPGDVLLGSSDGGALQVEAMDCTDHLSLVRTVLGKFLIVRALRLRPIKIEQSLVHSRIVRKRIDRLD